MVIQSTRQIGIVTNYGGNVTLKSFLREYWEEGGKEFRYKSENHAFEHLDYLRKVKHIIRKLSTSLTEAHSRNIFHRDIKLNNVLVEIEKGKFTVCLIDFGFATNSRFG